METKEIVNWLRDKACRADNPSWTRMMHMAADQLMRLEHRLQQSNAERDIVTKRMDELEDKQRWIPVAERLPEVERTVLVIDRVTGEVTTAYLNGFDSFVFRDGRGHGASYWMPLPESPKEVNYA